ncbi:hypothetical protein [Niallia sp. 01092]|uniref:hypothetical protein n=1 Tax=unclassified Niallia TaxID=2837522 RepID=UPI003FD3B140
MALFSFGKNKVINLIIKDHVIRFVELKHTEDLLVQNWGERYLSVGLIHESTIQDVETLSMILDECIQDCEKASAFSCS